VYSKRTKVDRGPYVVDEWPVPSRPRRYFDVVGRDGRAESYDHWDNVIDALPTKAPGVYEIYDDVGAIVAVVTVGDGIFTLRGGKRGSGR
jgi:hypothetical protein